MLKELAHENCERSTNGRLSSKKERMRIAKGVREFIEQNYELRYNTMKQTEEFRPKIHDETMDDNYKGGNKCCDTTNDYYKDTIWRQLTDREMRKIAIEQMEQVGVAWSMDV